MHSMRSLLLLVTATAIAAGQTISGTVTDGSAAAIPQARVTVTNAGTGLQQNTVTNEAGMFRAEARVPGSYRVEVESEGFQKVVRGPLVLEVGQVIALNIVLELGKATETLVITDAAPITESQTSTVGQVVN